MRIVTLANHKGGVGKTTTAFNLAAGLKDKKKKVLLIDLDAQENLAFSCGVRNDDLKNHSLYDVFHGNANVNDCIFQIYDDIPDFDILVGGVILRNADNDKKYVTADSIIKALRSLNTNYDFVVIDTPPSLNVLTESALKAADDLIIPIQPSPFSLQGIGSLNGFVKSVNPKINVVGLLLVGINERTNLGREFIEIFKKTAKNNGTKLFKAMIHNSVAIPESQINNSTIYDHAPNSTVAKDYRAFVDEYLKGIKKNG